MDARRCLRRCLLEMFSLVMSAIWPRAAAAAGALHQCVHLCRFYRCAAASNFHHAYTGDRTQASTAWMPGDVCWRAFRPNPYSTIPLVMSAVWPRAAAAAGALHQCVHLCRFYRCAAASNFHHASMQWVPTAAASAPAAAGALHQCVHLCRFYRCAAACLMIQSRLVAV